MVFTDHHLLTEAERLALDPREGSLLDATDHRWFRERGVSIMALASPWAVRAIHAVVTVDDRYSPAAIGDFAFVFAVIDRGIVDLVAWFPETMKMATRLGIGWALGQGQVGRWGAGTTAAALPVYRSPLRWLRADRQGIVIVDWSRAGCALSRVVIRAEDASHSRELGSRLRVPPPVLAERASKLAPNDGVARPPASAVGPASQ